MVVDHEFSLDIRMLDISYSLLAVTTHCLSLLIYCACAYYVHGKLKYCAHHTPLLCTVTIRLRSKVIGLVSLWFAEE